MAEPLAYTIAGAAAALGIGRTKLYYLIAAGRIDARKLGGTVLIPAASLKALLDGLPAAPIKLKPGRRPKASIAVHPHLPSV